MLGCQNDPWHILWIGFKNFWEAERHVIELSKRLDLNVITFSPNHYNELFRINDKQVSQMLGENTTLVVYGVLGHKTLKMKSW